MTKEFLHYDPHTGISDWAEDDILGRTFTLHRQEDVEPLLDRNAELRNTGGTDRGIKEDWWLVASIPMTVVMQLKNKGIDVFRAADEKAVERELRTNYPYLLTTGKRF